MVKTMLNNDLSVVIICYDPYQDAIELNPYFFNKNWNPCTANVYYVTSKVDVKTQYNIIKTNGDLSYYKRLDEALNCIKTKYVMLLLDDYLVHNKIDEKQIEDNILFMKENNIDYCELFTMFSIPKGKKINFKGNKYICISIKRKYRITLQPAIFKKSLLEEMNKYEPFGAWEAELIFTRDDFKKYNAYYALNKSFSVINYIDKGLVTRKAYHILKKEGLWANHRKVVSFPKAIKRAIIRKIYMYVPLKIKNKLKKNSVIYKG